MHVSAYISTHVHTRDSHAAPPLCAPLPRNLDAEGVVYPRAVTSLSTCRCPDIIDKSQFSRLRRDSTFRFSSSFIMHPCLPFPPCFSLDTFRALRPAVFLGRPIHLDNSAHRNSAYFLEKSLSVFPTQNLHFIGIDFSNLQARSSRYKLLHRR